MTTGISRTLDAEGLDQNTPDAIFTFTGKTIRPLAPDPARIDIADIAHALSNQCRFTGHLKRFSSVAEHSVRVAWLVSNDELKLEALLHDASEAYLSDIARPVKKAPGFAETYLKYEAALEAAVQTKFNLPLGEMHPLIKEADQYALEAEVAFLCHERFQLAMGVSPRDDWKEEAIPKGWPPQIAEQMFTSYFWRYWGAREQRALEAVGEQS